MVNWITKSLQTDSINLLTILVSIIILLWLLCACWLATCFSSLHYKGFHLCALIQQLFDILPDDTGVVKLSAIGQDLFEHFDGRMGCVEIVGKSSFVERVYFRIKQSRSMQWEDRAIKVSFL